MLKIVRGISGSGKSTLAKEIAGEEGFHVEADMFFLDANGVYEFDGSKIRQAHEWCKAEVDAALENGIDTIVSNTFTRFWEVQPYLDLAKKHGVKVEIIAIPLERNFGNIHGVPSEVIEQMKARWESIEGEYIYHG